MDKRIPTLALCALALSFSAPAEDGKPSAPPPGVTHWTQRMRAVGLPIPAKPDAEQVAAQGRALAENGVTVVVDHGSLQFVPGLPETKAQWTRQVDFDAAETFTRALKSEGLRVIHHTTSTFIPKEALDNPDYAAFASRDIRTGEVALRDPGTGYDNAMFADMNDEGFRAVIFPRMREYVRRTGADAFMTDEVQWLPNIYAGGTERGSRAKFQRLHGADYPSGDAVGNWESPLWLTYVRFRYQSGGDFYRALTEELRRENPEFVVSGCNTGMSPPWRRVWAMPNEDWQAGVSLGFFEMEAMSGKLTGKNYLYALAKNKYYREMALQNAIGQKQGFVNYVIAYPRSWKRENSEQFFCWAQASLMGHRYWMRDYQAETEWYAWEAEHEADLLSPRAIADVGVFFPEWSRDYQADSNLAYMDWSGWSEALADNAILYDQLLRWHLEEYDLSGYRVLIVPSERFLSARMAERLAAFVRQGGILVFSGHAGVGDPFAGKDASPPDDAGLGLQNTVWRKGAGGITMANDDVLPAGPYALPGGIASWPPADGEMTVAALGQSSQPGATRRSLGRGWIWKFAGRVGAPAFQDGLQGKLDAFKQTADRQQGRRLAMFVDALAGGRRVVEFHNLPEKTMVNAFDTLAADPARPRRTIHILDAADAIDDGQAWKPYGSPVDFTPWEDRLTGGALRITLRGLPGGKTGAWLISPDRPGRTELQLAAAGDDYELAVPAAALGRYSVVVVP